MRRFPMIRVQIQITELQARKLRKHAREQGISLAEAIRRSVERELSLGPPDLATLYERARKMVGALHDPEGATDLAEHHDRYLADAYR